MRVRLVAIRDLENFSKNVSKDVRLLCESCISHSVVIMQSEQVKHEV